jgi:hypothetical protein
MTVEVARRAQRPGSATSRAAAAFGVMLALAIAAMIPLILMAHQVFNALVALVIGVPCAAVGLIVARRLPRNPIGWLFLSIAVCLILGTDGNAYAILRYRLGDHLPGGPAALALGQLWGPGILLLVVVILLFPDGQLSSRFWRLTLGIYCTVYAVWLVATAVATAVAIARHPVSVDSTGGLSAVDHPTGWYGAVHSLGLVLLVLSLCFVGRQALSWRRSSSDRRQQLKWLASGAIVTVACGVLSTIGSSSHVTLLSILGGFAWFGWAALPVGIGVGILKYRLYDIDRIISRALAYAIVTGLLIGVYAGLVVLATQVLPFSGAAPVAAATLSAAALFSPLRRRVQHVVDRRFNRARYDADRTIAVFADRLSNAVDQDAVRADLLGTAHLALEPVHASVWLSDGSRAG